MIDRNTNDIGLPVYKGGGLKQFQVYTHYVNLSKSIMISYSNYLLSFGTPKVSKGATVDYVKLYKYSDGWQNTLTYSNLITYRDSGTLIDGIAFSRTKLNKTDTLYHSGNSEITPLNSGIYEIELTLSDGSIYESDLFCVDSENVAASQLPYILENDGVIMSDDGITPTTWY